MNQVNKPYLKKLLKRMFLGPPGHNTPPSVQPQTLSRNQKIMFGAVLCGFFTVLLGQFYFRNLSPDARQAHQFYREMPTSEIREIVIEAYPQAVSESEKIHLRDRQQIKRIADLLRTAQPFSPNHPAARWNRVLRIITDHGEFGGMVEATNNDQGVQIWYSSQIQGGWNYGIYRQDALGPVLEEYMHGTTLTP